MSDNDEIPQELRDRVAASDFDHVMKFDCGDDGVLVISRKEVTREDMEADCTIRISRKNLEKLSGIISYRKAWQAFYPDSQFAGAK